MKGWSNPITKDNMMFAYTSENKALFVMIVAVLLFGGIAYLSWSKQVDQPDPTACSQEAKICPDGSAVGRTEPKCEFAPCPKNPDNNGWKAFTDTASGISFSYPETLLTKYIDIVDWPPHVQVLNDAFTCTEAGTEIARTGKTEKRIVDNRTYCVTTATEGAAGSIYTQYAYAFPKDAKTIIFTFSLKAVQCGNYDEPKKTECEDEREFFDLDRIIDRIVFTTRLQ